jgi:hypothetical protein
VDGYCHASRSEAVCGLALDVSVHGKGTVALTPTRSPCTSSCQRAFEMGEKVGLVATPALGGSFFGWAGPCTGQTSCTVPLDRASTVGAWFAQADLAWAQRFGAAGVDRATDIAVDRSGNLIVVGAFSGMVSFGGDTLKSAGSDEVFVAKLSKTGQHIWSRSFAGSGADIATSVAVDASGNVLVTGSFAASLTIGKESYQAVGGSDIFVAKLSAAGEPVWSRRIGGSDTDADVYIAVDKIGDVLVLGTFKNMIQPGDEPLVSAGAREVFLAKLAGDGKHLWSKRLGGTNEEIAHAVATDSKGDVVVLAIFPNVASFGGDPMTSAGGDDVALAKFSSGGEYMWSKRLGGTGNDAGIDVAVGPGDEIVVTGNFLGQVDFGGGTKLSSLGGQDVFVATYDAKGGHRWSLRFGETGTAGAVGVTVNDRGQVLVVGTLGGTADFGGGLLSSTGGEDAFVAALSPEGAPVWSRVFGGTGLDAAAAVVTDAYGEITVAGSFSAAVPFDQTMLTSAGTRDVFLVKLTDALALQWALGFGGAGWTEAYSVGADRQGNAVFTGYFAGTVDFGGGVMTSIDEGDDLFVTKMSPLGRHLWSKSFEAPGADYGIFLSIDGEDNVLVSGYFADSVAFGPEPLVSVGGDEGFVVKISPEGEHVWSRGIGGTGGDSAYAVAADGKGNVYVTGFFTEEVDFGDNRVKSAGGDDTFVLKYSKDGQLLWSRTLGGGASDYAYAMAVGDDVVIAGYSDSAEIAVGKETLTTAGSSDVLVVAYSQDGDYRWGHTFGAAGEDIAWGLAASPKGGYAVTGYFVGPVDFGAAVLTSEVEVRDLYVLFLSASGTPVWARSFQGPGKDRGNAVRVDADGNVLVTGEFEAQLGYDGTPLFATSGGLDACVAKIAPDGNLLWVRRFGGGGNDTGYGITSAADSVIVTGNFEASADFWAAPPLTSAGSYDVFLARYAAGSYP